MTMEVWEVSSDMRKRGRWFLSRYFDKAHRGGSASIGEYVVRVRWLVALKGVLKNIGSLSASSLYIFSEFRGSYLPLFR